MAKTYEVTFADGRQTTVRGAVSQTEAMDVASGKKVRAAFIPISGDPVSATEMREVYMGGGYCLVPAQAA